MELLVDFLIGFLKALIVLFLVILPGASGAVYFERRIAAWIQMRIGPNRVGPYGLLQPIADVIKLIFKEDIIPAAADKRFHFLAPLISITITVAVFAVIPFGHYVVINGEPVYLGVAPNVHVGILYVLAMTSMGVYGLTLAGWASNNKYSLLGGLRSSAQMISYELAMGLSIVALLMVTGTPNLMEIVEQQAGWRWNVLYQPLGFLIFLVAAFAETNRTPFDLPEAEPELVGGYHTEYTGMKFGMFFLAEYGNVIAASAMMTTLFFGGWQVPFLPELLGLQEGSVALALLQVASFTIKVAIFVFFFIWVRWTVPRFRYDQLMRLGWKVLFPLSLANVLITGLVMLIN